jgi:NAD(P)-dependent dehydrogenase (short-subunit alcohol dehydrogenase family)
MASASPQKAVFITGAASGIGLAAAGRFAREGWLVGVADIDEKGVDAAVAALGAQSAVGLALDVRSRSDWTKAMDAFSRASGGRLDVLVNNAGIARYGWFEEVSPEEMDLQVDVNVKGVLNACWAALPLLRATPGARLLNIGSCAGLIGAPRQAAYSSTKFAVRGLSDALGVEFSRYGVGVACVMPWFVETPILDSGGALGNQSFRDAIADGGHTVCSVEEAAEVIWQAAHGDKTAYIVGRPGYRLQFMAQYFPKVVRRQLMALVARA